MLWHGNLENPAVATGLEKDNPHLIPKKGSTKECSNHQIIALISHASKVMLKILQAMLQHYFREFPDVQAGFRKGRGTRDQITTIHWITEKAREFQKNIYFCFIDYSKAFDCVNDNKLWEILKEIRIPGHLTCHPINLHVGQEATVRALYGTTDWFRIEEGVQQSCLLPSCLFNLYVDNIMRKPGWMSYKLESRLLGEISTTSDMWMPLL